MNKILKIKGVSKHFGGLKAINNVDLEVDESKVLGIIGPNGAGKTTLFNMIAGTIPVTAGQIYFNDVNITGMHGDRIARMGIGRTFQNIKLFNNLSVLENVKTGFHTQLRTNIVDAVLRTKTYRRDEDFARDKANEILKQIGMKEFALENAGNLAYGSKRRVEIARALALNPKVLLLDEPTAGMNPSEMQDLLVFIQMLREQKRTIIVIEHHMRFIMRLCDRIAVLNFGIKICEGSPQEVKEDEQVCEAYFGKHQQF
jgi:branched-chain amino acid transport system ATP-binding protein